MSTHEFLAAVRVHWPRVNITDETRGIWIRKLRKHGDEDRARIFDWLADHCPTSPTTARLFEAAEDLGILSDNRRQAAARQPYSVEREEDSDCSTCEGLGLVHVTGQWRWEKGRGFYHHGGLRTRPADQQTKLESGETDMMFRCTCSAGERQPKRVPLLDRMPE